MLSKRFKPATSWQFLAFKSASVMLRIHRMPERTDSSSINFIFLMQVTIKREEELVQEFVMSSKYTLAGIWSSIGASLNFWSGITVVLVAEVMEMIYRIIIDHACDKNKTKIKTITKKGKEIDD